MSLGSLAADKQSHKLRIYLPREVTVEDQALTLGSIAVLRGEEQLVAKAGDINLGKLSSAHRRMKLSKAMILGRLTGSGVRSSEIEVTGAEQITVSCDKLAEQAKPVLEFPGLEFSVLAPIALAGTGHAQAHHDVQALTGVGSVAHDVA